MEALYLQEILQVSWFPELIIDDLPSDRILRNYHLVRAFQGREDGVFGICAQDFIRRTLQVCFQFLGRARA